MNRLTGTLTLSAGALALLVGGTPLPLEAEEGLSGHPRGRRHMRGGPLRGVLFPPELVMRHSKDLDLSKQQRDAIIAEMQRTQSDLVPVQWEVQEETEKLRGMLSQSQVNEAEALAQAERVGSLEREVKKSHLALLIRIKNLLNDAQRAQLGTLAAERRHKRRSFQDERPE